jgi:rubrerythrin
MTNPHEIATKEDFLAHAFALEQESVDRYEELADAMDTHNNLEVAGLFRKMAEFGRKHAAEVERLAAGSALPTLEPWDFKWADDEGPETGDYADIDYMMTPVQALQFALANEKRSRDFYELVASHSPDQTVRELAGVFTREEEEHVTLLERWIARHGSDPAIQDDLDPPNIVD